MTNLLLIMMAIYAVWSAKKIVSLRSALMDIAESVLILTDVLEAVSSKMGICEEEGIYNRVTTYKD